MVRRLYTGSQVSEVTVDPVASKFAFGSEPIFHTRWVPSSATDESRSPRCDQAMSQTPCWCPRRHMTSVPRTASQIRTVPSAEAVANR